MASVTGIVIRVDERELRGHLDEVVRTSMDEALTACWTQAKRYERAAQRIETRAGSYDGKLQMRAGEVKLKVPHLRSLPI